MIEHLTIVVYNVRFWNQILIVKNDTEYHPILRIFIIHYQTEILIIIISVTEIVVIQIIFIKFKIVM